MISDFERQLHGRVAEIACRLLGEPNPALSTRAQLRFGRHGSLAVEIDGAKRGRWFDHEAKRGGGMPDLVMRELGLCRDEARAWLTETFGLETRGTFALETRATSGRRARETSGRPARETSGRPARETSGRPTREASARGPRDTSAPAPGGIAGEQEASRGRAPTRRIAATYDYRDEGGALVMQVVRWEPKGFRQRRPDGEGGWRWTVRGVRPVPYRLFELLAHGRGGGEGGRDGEKKRPEGAPEADRTVFVVEGEKDVDRLAALGLVATCNAGGANNWPMALCAHFEGLDVRILPDNDEAGRSHARKVASALVGIARDVRVVPLPGLGPAGDVSDWLDAGGGLEALRRLCAAASPWSAEDELEAEQREAPPGARRVVGPEPEPADRPGEDGPRPPDAGSDSPLQVAAGDEPASASGDEPASAARGELPPWCDEALALAFSARHGRELRWCEAFGRWFEWDGGRWHEDLTRRVVTHARRLCRERAQEAGRGMEDGKAAARVGGVVASVRAVTAVVSLARADARHATGADDWDRDPWVLNTPAGLLDLRTGRLGAHDRAALCSKITAVAPTEADCPRWRCFLGEITAGDAALQAFLARVAGYGLTGSTREHALFFLWGTGANGKGTFLNTLTGIMGDYARVAGMDTFTESGADRHPTELAMLRGARLVCAQETDEGRRWAEGRIKTLTGGDPVTARFMRQDFFTYTPQFKLLIAGNHKPGLRNIDEAIRRRFHLLPFTVRIPPERRDAQLAESLRAEWPAILGWAVRGCLDWQSGGLRPPPSVIEATSEYFEDEDTLGGWLAECCVRDPLGHEATRDLYGAWNAWAQRAGLSPGSEPKFRSALKARGFEAKRVPGLNLSGFAGLRLLRPDYTDDPRWGG